MIRQQAQVAILGDSIVEGLARYPAVWNDHLKPFNTVNCGIGGDSIQHLLWRVGHLSIPHVIVTGILPTRPAPHSKEGTGPAKQIQSYKKFAGLIVSPLSSLLQNGSVLLEN